jgi:hypothetical protein
MSKEKAAEITSQHQIEIRHEQPHALFFREAWADGEHEGVKFELTRNVSLSAIHFQYGDRAFTLKLNSIVEAFLDAAKKTGA